MKRSHVALMIAAAGAALLLLAVSMMTGRGLLQAAPLVQVTEESDNNDICSEADWISLAVPVRGAIDPITDTDWFSVTTQAGLPYYVSASMDEPNLKVRICLSDENCVFMSPCSSASASNVEKSWTATGNRHYVKIEKYDATTDTAKTTSYLLEVVQEYVSPTPPPTPSGPTSEDNYEEHNGFTNNDGFDEAYELPVVTSVSLKDLEGIANFYHSDESKDEDWFKFWSKAGYWYQATTSELSGVDTYLEIRDRNEAVMGSDDDSGGGYASQAQWEAGYNGYYYIHVTNKVETTGEYNLTVGEVGAPATSTPGPSPTPGPGLNPKSDSCEDNLDFAHACVIAANQSQTFNFVPPYGGVDNDYFKIWVKPGLIYDCATSSLDPGVDTNMIIYDHNQNGIGGNDDVEPGNPASAFSYYATYEGWLYLLVGVGDRTPSDIYNSNYTLRCDRRVPGQPTATSTPEKAKPTNTPGPTATPASSDATPTAAPTSAPSEGLTVHPLTTPTPVPATTPAPQFIPISLLVYYDNNDDRQPGAGEGIAGVSAQAYEAATNQLLAQGFTDDQGSLEFTVAAQGPVRVSVPFFGFSQLVTGEGGSIYVRVSSHPLPGEAP